MADASERIIILSAVVLVIIFWLPNSGLIQTIVTIDDLEIEIVTSRDNYTLGENFTANVYLVNTRSKDVWMEPINFIPFTGSSKNSLAGTKPHVFINVMDGRLLIPAKTKVLLIDRLGRAIDRLFTPTIAGEFEIWCSGVRKTVLILEPDVDYKKEGYGESTKKIKSVDAWLQVPDDFIDPEKALSHGYKGYVNVSYVSEMPARVIVSPGKTLIYIIRLELISHISEFKETRVVLDPKNSSGFGVGWGDPVPIFNDYIRYSPDGTFLVSVDKPCNVTMILSVPEGLPGMSAYPYHLLGVGINADVPVFNWITSDDG